MTLGGLLRPLLFFLTAACLAYLLGYIVHWVLARLGILDRPNTRSNHSEPTVRGGGIAIIIAIALCALFAGSYRIGGVWPMMLTGLKFLAVISLWDDVRSLNSLVRFCCHAVAAVLVLLALEQPLVTHVWKIPLVFGMFVWMTGYTNAFNFMDGINGIAALQALVTGIGTALICGKALGDWTHSLVLVSLVVAGAAGGFLPHNFPRARMFMGDVGSVPLGFILSALTLAAVSEVGWWIVVPLVLIHANFILDTGFTLLRRLTRGERWAVAHREHFYQRLVRAGKTHQFVTCCHGALQIVVIILMLGYYDACAPVRALMIGMAVTVWVMFYVYCERSFQRVQAAT